MVYPEELTGLLSGACSSAQTGCCVMLLQTLSPLRRHVWSCLCASPQAQSDVQEPRNCSRLQDDAAY